MTDSVGKNEDVKMNDKSTSSKKGGSETDKAELSEEDRELRDRLTLMCERMFDDDLDVQKTAMEGIKEEIRTATASMTSVPKPLKFLRPHYESIKKWYDDYDPNSQGSKTLEMKSELADLMSVLAMVMEEPKNRMCLRYRLHSSLEYIEKWGAQYVKHLSAEIRMELEEIINADGNDDKLKLLINMDSIMAIVEVLIKFNMQHSSENEACDIALEIERLDLLKKECHNDNVNKVCEYLRASAYYLPYPDDQVVLECIYDLYLKYDLIIDALRYALVLDSRDKVNQVMNAAKDKSLETLRQCAYLLGWHNYYWNTEIFGDEFDEEEMPREPDLVIEDGDEVKAEGLEQDEDDDFEVPEIDEIICNVPLSDAFHDLARDLDVLEPKDPESDIFKEQLLDDASVAGATDVVSAKKSMAISYVNGFVNAGYGRDKKMCTAGGTPDTASTSAANLWLGKNKERGKLAAVASVGLTMLWDENAVNLVDRYFESEHSHYRAGANLAIGIACSGMRSEAGLGYALLSQPCMGKNPRKPSVAVTNSERICAIFALGLAYAGQSNDDVYSVLGNLVTTDASISTELSSVAALSLGLVFVGTCNVDISNLILADLLDRDPEKLSDWNYLFNALGLALLFLRRSEDVEVTLEAVAVFEELNPIFYETVKTMLHALAFAGSGNVVEVQHFINVAGRHFDEEDKKKKEEEKAAAEAAAGGSGGSGGAAGGGPAAAARGADGKEDEDDDDEPEKDDGRYFQSIAVLGIALTAIGEELGSQMALRMFDHLIQYGNTRVKRSVPLALATLCISDPKLEVCDVLSKLSHDHDNVIAQNAILALGLVGMGTNNARIASMLRDLTTYYARDPNHLYLVRIAQGFVHLGKGLLTAQPYHSDRLLLSKVALSGMVTLLVSCMCDLDKTILGEMHWLILSTVLAFKPRMLTTLDARTLRPAKVSVRVGQALDTVGTAGRQKRITGFQTHDTPVLLSFYRDRAELATDEYISMTPVLEGFVIVKPNPNADSKKSTKKSKK